MRRLYCLGTEERPCPARAWWYYAGRGRPVERCRICRDAKKHEKNLADWSLRKFKAEPAAAPREG